MSNPHPQTLTPLRRRWDNKIPIRIEIPFRQGIKHLERTPLLTRVQFVLAQQRR
jgi:hypothetical protein